MPKPEKLAELLSMRAFEVEETEKVGNDWVLDIDILPNRGPDCFSHLGVAREIATILNSKLKTQNSKPKEDKNLKAKDFVTVEVRNKVACPRYTARVITDIKVGLSPKWIKDRLKVCGLRPVNNIVDIANYVMLETGQPLHAFDLEKIGGQKIIVRRAKRGERIITLDNEKPSTRAELGAGLVPHRNKVSGAGYDLDKDILIIADSKEPLAIAGIKGGKKAEITKSTKNVVLESANFNPRVIRAGRQKIDLKTDSSWRFEHGIDPNLTELAINRAAGLIQEIAGGKILRGLIDFYSRKVLPKKIKLDLDYVTSLLGIKIPAKEIKNILNRLNFQCNVTRQHYIEVRVPTFRLDILMPEDLIEEIGRIYGYEKIPSDFPISALIPPKRNLEIFWEDLTKNILKEVGFSEVYNYSFIGEKEAKIFGYDNKNLIEVENPISIGQKYLQPSLIPNLLKNIKENLKHFKEIKIFEIGKVFKENFKEKRILTGVITGEAFYQAKGVVDLLLNSLGISNIWYDEYQPTPEESKLLIWHPKKCAEIKVNHQEIGFLGEISSNILQDLKIESKVALFDINFEKLQSYCSEEHEFRPISPYPAAVRDIAVLVPGFVRVEEVLNKIEIAGGPLVKDVDLFDIYEGEELPKGKKNLAFHLIYQAEDHTLSSKEIEEIHSKIIKVLEKDPEWQVRK